jgi:nicotinamidase/pyrazinamidase
LLPLNIADLIKKHVESGGEFFFQKQNYDVFTNAYLNNSIEDLGIERVIMYGVATDYCVKAAAIGMAKRKIEVYVLTDAIKAVASDTEKQALAEMRSVGIKFVQSNDLEQILGDDKK